MSGPSSEQVADPGPMACAMTAGRLARLVEEQSWALTEAELRAVTVVRAALEDIAAGRRGYPTGEPGPV